MIVEGRSLDMIMVHSARLVRRAVLLSEEEEADDETVKRWLRGYFPRGVGQADMRISPEHVKSLGPKHYHPCCCLCVW